MTSAAPSLTDAQHVEALTRAIRDLSETVTQGGREVRDLREEVKDLRYELLRQGGGRR